MNSHIYCSQIFEWEVIEIKMEFNVGNNSFVLLHIYI